MAKQRDSNIELLRIVLMIMVVLIHYILRGYNIEAMIRDVYDYNDQTPYLLGTFTVIILAVNCFVFISGYYSIRLKINNIANFIIQAFFYSFLNVILAKLFLPGENILHTGISHILFPISSNHWWFLNVYLAIYLLSPIVNVGLNYLNRNQYRFIIIALLYLQTTYIFTGQNFLSTTGHGLYSLLFMYILGRYFSIYQVNVKRPFIKFAILIPLLFILFYYIGVIKGHQSFAWRLLTYNSVFIVIASVLFFYIFKNISIKSNTIINKIAALSFGVYLFHESESMKVLMARITAYIPHITNNPLLTILVLIFLSILTFSIGIVLEKLRLLILKPLLNLVYSYLDKIKSKYHLQ